MTETRTHHRRSIRLKDFNYRSTGYYYVTICTYGRQMLFGHVVNNDMVLNTWGRVVDKCWLNIPIHFPNTVLDQYIVMPNHIHGIIYLKPCDKNGAWVVGAKNFSSLWNNHQNKFQSPSKTIGSIIRGFKIGVTKIIRNNSNLYYVWQRNYYDHIIRNEKDLSRIRHYILNNPCKW